MELDLCDKLEGKIWQRKPVAGEDGLLLKVKHTLFGSLSGPYRSIRFLKVCFHGSRDCFLASDHLGYIFLFDLASNRFSLVKRFNEPFTATAFAHHHKIEFLAGLQNNTAKCFDNRGTQIAVMAGHTNPIHSICVDMSGSYALTTSSETANLWDLATFQRKHKLTIKEDVGLLQAFFVPNSKIILTCFRDDSIFGWDLNSLECKFQLPVPSAVHPHYSAFAVSQDSCYLVAGGKSRFLHLWSLEALKLIKVIELPVEVSSVKQLEFLSSRQDMIKPMLAVLTHDGVLLFIDVDSCRWLFDVGSVDSKIKCVAFSPACHCAVTVMEDGKLHIYDIDAMITFMCKKSLSNSLLLHSVNSEHSYRRIECLQKSSRPEVEKCLKICDQENLHFQVLNKEKLLTILKGYGEYPAKYRMFIWRKILQLPDNFQAYAGLAEKGVHPSYSKLNEVYPIKSHKLLRVLQRVLSALAHWSPVFGETQYLPSLCFPFVRLFQNNHLTCFEVMATILVNWSQHWFEYFPNPPVNVLGMIENVLAHHDFQLLQHFVKFGVTSQTYAWSLLETAFSEVLTQTEWLMLWDNVLSNSPAFLLMCVVAYSICARGSLLKCNEVEDFKFFFHHRNALGIKPVITKAYKLMENSPDNVHPETILEDFVPLPKGSYPIFNKYPKFIVDYQVLERERIYQEELEYLKQKHKTLETDETDIYQPVDGLFCDQHKLLKETETKKRMMKAQLSEQNQRILATHPQDKPKEFAEPDTGRRKFNQHQEKLTLQNCDDGNYRKQAITERDGPYASIEGWDRNNQRRTLEEVGAKVEEPTMSFSRSEHGFDEKELTLLQEIRQLRQRLATDSRNKRPPLNSS